MCRIIERRLVDGQTIDAGIGINQVLRGREALPTRCQHRTEVEVDVTALPPILGIFNGFAVEDDFVTVLV